MAIREYCYFCEKCAYEFSEFIDWADIAGYKPGCAMCKSNKDVYRQFNAERVIVDDNVPKTVGMLADKNSKKNNVL